MQSTERQRKEGNESVSRPQRINSINLFIWDGQRRRLGIDAHISHKMRKTLTANGAHCNQNLNEKQSHSQSQKQNQNQNQRPAPCRTLGDNAPPPMVPQTSPRWRRHSPSDERTKAALSVIAASNCASGTDRTSGRTQWASSRKQPTAKMTVYEADESAGQRRQFVRTGKTLSWQRIWLTAWLPLLLAALQLGTRKYSSGPYVAMGVALSVSVCFCV